MLFYVFGCFACMHILVLLARHSCRGQKRASHPLELNLETVVSHYVHAGNMNLGLLKEQPVHLTLEPSLQQPSLPHWEDSQQDEQNPSFEIKHKNLKMFLKNDRIYFISEKWIGRDAKGSFALIVFYFKPCTSTAPLGSKKTMFSSASSTKQSLLLPLLTVPEGLNSVWTPG